MSRRGNIFTKAISSKLPSNNFKDLTYSNKVDMDIGYLYPIHVEDIVPGDIFFAGHGAMVRSQPMVTPLMHNFNYNIRWFFVPNRLVWTNFESFICDQEKGKKDPGLESPHVHPYIAAKTQKPNYLHDLLGLPPLDGEQDYDGKLVEDYVAAGLHVDALPYRAYYMIWNEYFKDENTMDDLEYADGDGADQTEYELQKVSWKKDYFTSALPFAQRGDPVQIIGNVYLDPAAEGYDATKHQILTGLAENGWLADNTPAANALGLKVDPNDGTTVMKVRRMTSSSADYQGFVNIDPNGTLDVGLSFNAIRRATAVQRFLERSALGGNRYAELLLAHFGVRSSDQSLQRPQYLGGGSYPINISPVEQNSATGSGETPQGTLAGKGVGVGSMYMNKPTMFTEHGYLIGVAFIRPDADYFNGIRRNYLKEDRYDYFWADFQNIGEQEIKNCELFAVDSDSDNLGTFGYQSRYAHYKWHGNEVHGAFRKELRSWVAPREFTTLPTLSKEFIECSLDISNNMAISPEVFPPFMVEALNVVNARRPMYFFNRGVL